MISISDNCHEEKQSKVGRVMEKKDSLKQIIDHMLFKAMIVDEIT